MAPATPRLRILSVGGNAVSAFLSWRLQATNACDVTLVWKAGYENVAQYGISIKSQQLGNERFKPYAVVRTPEEANQGPKVAFDYVLLCVKALPDVYDLAGIIKSVVTPNHTCILLNTTSSIGIEDFLEEKFDTNVVLSLVCGAELSQLGPGEFEHRGSASMWVGWANDHPLIPKQIQRDMAEALSMTLSTAQVQCNVSDNIREQQLDRMIGQIAFHPASVLFNNPDLASLYNAPGASVMIDGVIDELIVLAGALGVSLRPTFKAETLERTKNFSQNGAMSVMYQDYLAKRPMEIETFLGSPLKLAKKLADKANLALPRIEVLYALLHDKNQKNLNIGSPSPTGSNNPSAQNLPPRTSSMAHTLPPGARSMGNMHANGKHRPATMGSRAPSMTGPPHGGRRPGPSAGPYPGHQPHLSNNYRNGSMSGPFPPPMQSAHPTRRDSTEGENLEEFSHVMLYEDVADSNFQDGSSGSFGDQQGAHAASGGLGSGGLTTQVGSDLALRERELALRRRELDLREREQQMMAIRRPGPPMSGPPMSHVQGRRPPPRQSSIPMASAASVYGDQDNEDDYFDPMSGGGRPGMGEEHIDMMSITSKKRGKKPLSSSSGHQRIQDDSASFVNQTSHAYRSRNLFNRKNNRSSAQILKDLPSAHDAILNSSVLGISSNRYGSVDRQALEAESRQNSIVGSKMEELTRASHSGGPYPQIRRISQAPGNTAMNSGSHAHQVHRLGPGAPPQAMAHRPGPPQSSHNGQGPNAMRADDGIHKGGPLNNGTNMGMGMVAGHGNGNGNGNGNPNASANMGAGMSAASVGNSGPAVRQSSMPIHQGIEQDVGVSSKSFFGRKSYTHQPVRNLTASASNSAQSGDNASVHTGSANSAASSSSSLQPRPHAASSTLDKVSSSSSSLSSPALSQSAGTMLVAEVVTLTSKKPTSIVSALNSSEQSFVVPR